jgi:fucokinase
MRVVGREMARGPAAAPGWPAIEQVLRRLRILILHAGGDSRRVPAYGPCGKIFSPLPGRPAGPVICTLFDRLFPLLRDLPPGPAGAGQIVVAAGDALVMLDPAAVRLDRPGITALAAYAAPEVAGKHGVFCTDSTGRVRRFLQKASPAEQARCGAVRPDGRALLDVAVMSFDARAAVAMLRALDVEAGPAGAAFSPAMEQLVLERGLDLYREVCCALGSETTVEDYRASVAASGSTWPAGPLARLHRELCGVPFHAEVLSECGFLHFGTTRQLITSGQELLGRDLGGTQARALLNLNNRRDGGRIEGADSWVEGCRLAAPLQLAGQNVVVGVDVVEPLTLPQGACLDVLAGRTPSGKAVWFVRCYHVADTFKDSVHGGATLLARPLLEWLAALGVDPADVWDSTTAAAQRSLWNARVFPAVDSAAGYRQWLWMFEPRSGPERKQAFLAAERFSPAEMALLADLDAFYARRTRFALQPG